MISIKYWEFEDAPFKDKARNPKISDVARLFFDNETSAYRFAALMLAVKRSKGNGLRLKDAPQNIPLSSAIRYLSRAVEMGMLKHEDGIYYLTDRYTRPLKNIAAYIKAWSDSEIDEDIEIQFATAKTQRQEKRGGKIKKEEMAEEQKEELPK